MSVSSTHIISGPIDNSQIPKQSIGVIILNHLRSRLPNEVINIDAVNGDTLTCKALTTNSIKVTKILKDFSIKQGDVITIISENSINYIVIVLGALYLGIVVNVLNPAYSIEELRHAFNLAKPKLILCSETCANTVLQLKKELQFIETIILLNDLTENHCKVFHLKSKMNEVSDKYVDNFAPLEINISTVAIMLMSSGTTGLPKCVMLTHQNLRMALVRISNPDYSGYTSKDTAVLVTPFFHIYGFINQLGGIYCGTKIVILSKFRPDLYLNCIQQYRATVLSMVPTLLHFLGTSNLVLNYDLSSIKYIWHGGAPISAKIYEEAKRRFPHVLIRTAYSLTETSGHGIMQPGKNIKLGSIGTPMADVQAKIWDSKTRQNLPALKVGEICLKGPMVMKGYIGGPTDVLIIDEGGFFHTGDLGYYDEEGHIYIVGRSKELIKYKGFQVPPAEVEELLLTNPNIEDCGVIGIPDEKCGQLPFAYVVLREGASISEQDVVDYVASRISPQKRLWGGVKFVKEITRNSTGKILRHKLLANFQNEKYKA